MRPHLDGCGSDYLCFAYELELLHGPEAGERLRFGIDYQEAHLNDPDWVDYDVVILDRKGQEVARAWNHWIPQSLTSSVQSPVFTGEESNGNLEVFVDNPTDGPYTAVVIAAYVPTPGSGFQPRVKLEEPYAPSDRDPGKRRLLLPNVQPYSPHDLSFGCGLFVDDPLPPGDHTLACDDRLRFDYGYGNAGEGPLRLEFTPATDGPLAGKVFQRIFREPDERNAYDADHPQLSIAREAGTYHLHHSHHHYHYDPMFQVQLFSYDPDTGDRQKEGRALKVGNCGHDWFMTDFMTSFGQDPRGIQHSDGCTGAPGQGAGPTRVGVSAGWGDIYGSDDGDSYVAFAEKNESGEWERYDDGHYLLVETVNVDNKGSVGTVLLESDTTDNIGYTHLLVTEDGPCVIERGLGASPQQSIRKELPSKPSSCVTDVAFTDNTATSAQYTDESIFEAQLTDSNGEAIQRRKLTFTLSNEESSRDFTATTDEKGVASVVPTVTEKPGSYQLSVRYDGWRDNGDANHGPSSAGMSFVVDREDSDTELTVEGRGQSMTLTARLSDLDTPSGGIADRTIDFYSDGQLIGTDQTDSEGVAAIAVPRGHVGANRTYEAVFGGDDFYRASSDHRPPGQGRGQGNGTTTTAGTGVLL